MPFKDINNSYRTTSLWKTFWSDGPCPPLYLPLKKHKKLGTIARYLDQNKVFGFTDFKYYYIVDSFEKSQWCPIYRFSTVSRLFHDFQNVEWFVLSWITCICNAECVLTTLKDLHYCWMIWTVQRNFLLENIPQKIASEFSLPWKSQQ